MDAKALYPFGHGLSYSEFEYSDLIVSVEGEGINTRVNLSVKVKNISDKDGDEVVQLYLRDMVSGVLSPVKQLRGFERISIKSGETKNVHFEILPKELSLFNVDMEQVAEAGEFEVMIGASSEDIRLKITFQLSENITINK